MALYENITWRSVRAGARDSATWHFLRYHFDSFRFPSIIRFHLTWLTQILVKSALELELISILFVPKVIQYTTSINFKISMTTRLKEYSPENMNFRHLYLVVYEDLNETKSIFSNLLQVVHQYTYHLTLVSI